MIKKEEKKLKRLYGLSRIASKICDKVIYTETFKKKFTEVVLQDVRRNIRREIVISNTWKKIIW